MTAFVASLSCNGERHRLAFADGTLQPLDHDDDAERALTALGGPLPPCLHAAELWQRPRLLLTHGVLFSRTGSLRPTAAVPPANRPRFRTPEHPGHAALASLEPDHRHVLAHALVVWAAGRWRDTGDRANWAPLLEPVLAVEADAAFTAKTRVGSPRWIVLPPGAQPSWPPRVVRGGDRFDFGLSVDWLTEICGRHEGGSDFVATTAPDALTVLRWERVGPDTYRRRIVRLPR